MDYRERLKTDIYTLQTARQILELVDESPAKGYLLYRTKEDYDAWMLWLKRIFPKAFTTSNFFNYNKYEDVEKEGHFRLYMQSTKSIESLDTHPIYYYITSSSYTSYPIRYLRSIEHVHHTKNLYSSPPNLDKIRYEGLSPEEQYKHDLLKGIENITEDE